MKEKLSNTFLGCLAVVHGSIYRFLQRMRILPLLPDPTTLPFEE